MSTQVGTFIDVRGQARATGLCRPGCLAILPRNFESASRRDELVHDATGLSVRAAWRADGLDETRLEPDGEIWPAAQRDAAEWIGPIIFVAAHVLPSVVNIGLGVIANYVTDLLRGVPLDRLQRSSRS